MMQPNLFFFATKELSQDAILAWLLQWAHPACEAQNRERFKSASCFLRLLLQQHYKTELPAIASIDAGRQWENIDVWAEVYFVNGTKLLIIIEDKTFSGEHSRQLERYRETALAFCAKNDFELCCIFLKIGSEPQKSLESIRSKGYHIISRKDIIACLKTSPYQSSEILSDYLHYVESIEQAHTSFETLPPAKWEKGLAWVGFFVFVESKIPINTWHWVNNPRGGFWNLCLTWEGWHSVPVYMQIEESRICYKIALGEEETDLDNSKTDVNGIQDFVAGKLYDYYKVHHPELGVCRPSHVQHNGNYRTLAVVQPETWIGDIDSPINKDAVIGWLKRLLASYHDFIRMINEVSYETAGIQVTPLADVPE